jgi:outer membrane protein OmpA-like peptidoglycan-associated protein
MVTLRAITIPLLLLLALRTVAQGGGAEAHTRYADRYYQQMAYRQAADEYLLAARQGAVNEHVTKRLADCYMKLGDTQNAEQWYAQVVKFLNRSPEDLLNYSLALKGNGRYAEAEEWMDRYLAEAKTKGAPLQSNITDFARKFTMGQDRFTIRPSVVNTPFSDMAATWAGPGLVVFASSRHEHVGVKRYAAWNGQPFLDLYLADRVGNGDLLNVRPLEGAVNSNRHEGPVSCSVDGGVMWFTRNNPVRSKSGVNRLCIMRARREGDRFAGVEPFLYNNTECSVGHPALSPDGSVLFFVSDMPGGQGGSDLYMCRNNGGHWGEPENLGPAINTPLDEVFPHVGGDGTLYFASNGHPGLGGLDIQAAPRAADGSYGVVINVGAPVNGPKDDFAFVVDAAGRSGFFTSNRPGGAGDDDIYLFEMHRPLEQRFLCTGVVIDDDNGAPVIDLEVRLLNVEGNVVDNTSTDAKGKFSFTVEEDREYRLLARMKGRYDAEAHFSTERIAQQQIVSRDLHLTPDAGIWLRGAVRQAGRLGFVEGVSVNVVNLSSFQSDVRTTGPGGDINMRLPANEEFEVLLEKPGHFSMSLPVSTVGMKQGLIDLNAVRPLEMEEVVVGRAVQLKHVRWADGGSRFDPIARTELDGLAERIQVNPGLRFEVGVHEDGRMPVEKADALTRQRAEALQQYLVSKGVPAERVLVKAYGNGSPLNHCAPGVQCTAEEHAENRRVEYTVTSDGTR